MPKITIDGVEIDLPAGYTIMEACRHLNIEIPHFCYHPKLSIAGNCRMCLVEIEKNPKLVASCAMPISEGMIIHTTSDKVKKSREGVMELLLLNHPLDCPVCDQGGECDLQDQAFKYGAGKTKSHEERRLVPQKSMGPLIHTHMTRCIHCMRCVRFATEIAGIEDLGTSGRGELTEITSYLNQAVKSEISGNMIDLCPVGALTSEASLYKYRNWELTQIDSIDVMDAVGSNIMIESNEHEIIRILPRENNDINEIWISDKARFSFDAMKNQRLDVPYIRKNGKLVASSWNEAISIIRSNIHKYHSKEIGAIAGTLCDLESMFLLKEIFNKIGSYNTDFNQYGYYFDKSNRGNYLFNSSIKAIDEADYCILIGAYPRKISPVMNARIGKQVRAGKLKIGRIGIEHDETYPIQNLSEYFNLNAIKDFIKDAKNPMIIIGDSILIRKDADQILYQICEFSKKHQIIRDDWNGFNILHNHASTVGALDIGFYPIGNALNTQEIATKCKIIYLLGADDIEVNKEAFVVYQGHHGDRGAARADVILPAASYTEKDGLYVNLEGKLQYANKATNTVGEAKDDRDILLLIAKALELHMDYDNLDSIRKSIFDSIHYKTICPNPKVSFKIEYEGPISKKEIKALDNNYYMTDSISRNSLTMSKCL